MEEVAACGPATAATSYGGLREKCPENGQKVRRSTLKIGPGMRVHQVGLEQRLDIEPVKLAMLIGGKFGGQFGGSEFVGDDDVMGAYARFFGKIRPIKVFE